MALTVLQVAFPFAPLGIDAVGGAEQVLTACDAAVAQTGHQSIVIACEGSRTQGQLLAVPRVARADDPGARAAAQRHHKQMIDGTIDKLGVDVIHCHGIDFDAYLPRAGVSVLVTLHLDPSAYSPRALTPTRPGTYFNCVSRHQHARCRGMQDLLPPIANGIDVEQLKPDPGTRRKHALVLARICPEKGIHVAITAAKKADIDLVIAGGVFPYADHERYFAQEVQPLLDERRVFVGPVGFDAKRRLLQEAHCLLVPSLVAETSSLVAMEALACGTPVIAFRRGAITEIIENGVTGFLVDGPDEIAEAIASIGSLRETACVDAARRRFTTARMTGEYLRLYQELAYRDAQQSNQHRLAS
jgi:glycosyltransferase involved in cell wall biosynthesis